MVMVHDMAHGLHQNNDEKNLKEVYNSDLVITLDELPKFTADK